MFAGGRVSFQERPRFGPKIRAGPTAPRGIGLFLRQLDVEGVTKAVTQRVGQGSGPVPQDLPFSKECKKVLDMAVEAPERGKDQGKRWKRWKGGRGGRGEEVEEVVEVEEMEGKRRVRWGRGEEDLNTFRTTLQIATRFEG